MQKKFAKTCLDGTKKEMGGMQGIPQMDAMLTEYCNCSAEKAVANLSKDELNEVDKNPESEKSKAALQKIRPQLESCGQQMKTKLESTLGNMQTAPQP